MYNGQRHPFVAATGVYLPQHRQPPSVRLRNAVETWGEQLSRVTEHLWDGTSHFDNVAELIYDEERVMAVTFDAAGNWDFLRRRMEIEITQNMMTGLRGMLPSMWSDLLFFQYLLEAVENVLQLVCSSDRQTSFTYTGAEVHVLVKIPVRDPLDALVDTLTRIDLGDALITSPLMMSFFAGYLCNQRREVVGDGMDILDSAPNQEELAKFAREGNWPGFLGVASILPQNVSDAVKAIFADGNLDGMFMRMLMQELGINGKRGVTGSFQPPSRIAGDRYPTLPNNLFVNITSVAITCGYLRFVQGRKANDIRGTDFDLRSFLAMSDAISFDLVDGMRNRGPDGIFYLRFLGDMWSALPKLDCHINKPPGAITQGDRHPCTWLQIPRPPPLIRQCYLINEEGLFSDRQEKLRELEKRLQAEDKQGSISLHADDRHRAAYLVDLTYLDRVPLDQMLLLFRDFSLRSQDPPAFPTYDITDA
ncbi:hypothetical protein DXG01_008233 [Tephrocybe rancida]|nr:hypothetical protein DXG01_008233 [Tephrocybe rancida]